MAADIYAIPILIDIDTPIAVRLQMEWCGLAI
jgi:hypothetical protein